MVSGASRKRSLRRAVIDDAILLRLSVGRNSQSRLGLRIRRLMLKSLLAACGERLVLGPGAWIRNPGQISIGSRFNAMPAITLFPAGYGEIAIGDDCSLNVNVQILSGPEGKISIGSNVLIGPNTVLRNCNHRWRDDRRTIHSQGHDCRDILIADDVWIGANVVILGGVTIHSGTVVAAGAVVRPGTYGPSTLLVGNPAVPKPRGNQPAVGDGAYA